MQLLVSWNIFNRKGKKKASSPFPYGKNISFCASSKNCKIMSHLTEGQRYQIQALFTAGFNQKYIADYIGKDKSVICRELKRNCDQRNGEYRADLAIRKCANRHKNKPKRKNFTKSIKDYVDKKLESYYSPEQIVGDAKRYDIPCVSVERIYQYIWDDKKQGGDLHLYLRTRGKRYRKRGSSKDSRGIIVDRIGIDQRPQIVEQRSRIGDLEIDLVIGKNHKRALVTINDRATGKVKIGLVMSKKAEEVRDKAISLLKEWKDKLHTITSDNGKEFALHKDIAKSLEIDYYFARPYHSWERGSNENFNGLLRQYFPKKIDFQSITEEQIKHAENQLNNRPRKRFGYLSPNEVYLQALNNNGQVAFIT